MLYLQVYLTEVFMQVKVYLWTKDAFRISALSPRGFGGESQRSGGMWRVAHLGVDITPRAIAGDESFLEVSDGSLFGARVEGGPYWGCGGVPKPGG